MEFLKLLLSGEKLMLDMNMVRGGVEKVERFEAFKIENLLEYCTLNIPRIFDYLPNHPNRNNCSRSYILVVGLDSYSS